METKITESFTYDNKYKITERFALIDGIWKLHSDTLPAYECTDGKIIYYRNGHRHREGAPAFIQGSVFCWYQDALCHREDGPAYKDGVKQEYYLKNKYFTLEDYCRYLDKQSFEYKKNIIKTTDDLNILSFLALDNNFRIRDLVASHPLTSLPVLERLAEDSDLPVRMEVARNPNISIDLMYKLSKDRDYFVKEFLILNPNISYATLIKLSNDSNSSISWKALDKLKTFKYYKKYCPDCLAID